MKNEGRKWFLSRKLNPMKNLKMKDELSKQISSEFAKSLRKMWNKNLEGDERLEEIENCRQRILSILECEKVSKSYLDLFS